MRAAQHDSRLLEREAQSRSWAAPMPDFTVLPRVGAEPRTRLEWETRDTMNNRLWADLQATGPKAVSSGMLAEHPTAGAEPWMPSAGRLDRRSFGVTPIVEEVGGQHGIWQSTAPIGGAQGVGFAHMPGVLERPTPPGHGAWTTGMDAAGFGAVREMRGVIKETLSGRAEDSAGRVAERLFQNQWMTREDQQRIVGAQLAAAEALRPGSDDYRVAYRGLKS